MRAMGKAFDAERAVRKRLIDNSPSFSKIVSEEITKQITSAVREIMEEMDLITTLPRFDSDAMKERQQIVKYLDERIIQFSGHNDGGLRLQFKNAKRDITQGAHWDDEP